MADSDSKPIGVVGASARRAALERFVAGRSCYIADGPATGALVVKLVRSTIVHARVLSIDTVDARKAPGVIDIVIGADLAKVRPQPSLWDLPGQNYSNLKALAVDTLLYVGHPYAAIVASSTEAADAAAALISLECRPLPFHMTIDQATAA